MSAFSEDDEMEDMDITEREAMGKILVKGFTMDVFKGCIRAIMNTYVQQNRPVSQQDIQDEVGEFTEGILQDRIELNQRGDVCIKNKEGRVSSWLLKVA
jgi:hypothetical protein